MSKIQIVARFKDSEPDNPRFTKTTTLEELFKEALKSLPVDLIYYILPHQDGLGYTLKEAGVLTLNIETDLGKSNPATPTLAPAPIVPQDTMEEVVEEAKSQAQPKRIPPPNPARPIQSLSQTKFSQPKSQDQLAKELGIQDQKIQLHIPKGEGQDFNEYDENLNPIAKKKKKRSKELRA
jgi:hypothetical protein